jgi:ATP-binding cassette, subfamily B, bacterial
MTTRGTSIKNFPLYTQFDAADCGPTCLRMVAKYYGKLYSLKTFRERCFITHEGVSMLGISDAAESIGFRTKGVRLNFEQLVNEAPLPCISHWKKNHFVVIYKINGSSSNFSFNKIRQSSDNEIRNKKESPLWIHIADPSGHLVKYKTAEFKKAWLSTHNDGEVKGHCLLLEPTPEFYQLDDEKIQRINITFLLEYLRPYKSLIVQLLLSFLVGSGLQLLLPFLTQSIVDKGVNYKDLSFLTLVLFAQLSLIFGQTTVEFIRGWIMLHLTTRVNISLISDFLIKLMRLPIAFFDSKMIGDLMQRIGDNSRIQSFLTSTSLNILFAIANFVLFGCVIAFYNARIFFIFLIGSTVYVLWVIVFLKYRRELDYRRFAQMANNQSNLIQLITGMQEIKLNNCEKQKRWDWERIQAMLFKISIKGLILGQYQQGGAVLVNGIKNVTITFFTAKAVIDGQMTLGMMLAIQYIIGQLNSPIDQFIGFIQSWQDAKISLERLGEIEKKDAEDTSDKFITSELPIKKDISMNRVSFQYEGPHSPYVLDEMSLKIPANQVTAIVGTSGSGKTTFLKLLLGFHNPTQGEILVDNIKLESINCHVWRQHTGAVMQDGFIFSDTIVNNIALTDETVDKDKLYRAVTVANIREFIESLPLGYNTKIGGEGHGISEGQKQRILIARIVYKNPEFIFFDEATNALDANNELIIMDNLKHFFKGKTVIIVAHRLSTVKNADNIIVLDRGKIVEQGKHSELSRYRGSYYNLVKNQLELGN